MATTAAGSSRIFIRNLPPSFSDSEFRSHFSRGREVTDARLFTNRRIGYVGYKSAGEAAAAVKYFNKSFIRMSKIAVELASPYADGPAHKRDLEERQPHRENRESREGQPNPLKRKRDKEEKTKDPKLNEFLGIMNPSTKKTWQNEVMEGVENTALPRDIDEAVSDEEIQVIPAKKHGKDTIMQELDEDVDYEEPHPIQPSANLDQSDDTWLRSKTARLPEDQERNSEELIDDVDDGENVANEEYHVQERSKSEVSKGLQPPSPNSPENQGEPSLSNTLEDKIRSNGRLYIRNLPFKTTEDDLREHFSSFDSLAEVRIRFSHSHTK
jgi:multiple RNA-binding domain-containing protein 1